MIKEKINWGILGCGKIAHAFAEGLSVLPSARLLAVASRSGERAAGFAKRHNAERNYADYESLAVDPDVDVIYIATPHNFHFEHTLLSLDHNKSVLIEKPICVNAKETRKLIETARGKQVFLMEAMWTRFLPVIEMIKNWLKDSVLGEVKMLFADFGFNFPFDAESRIFNPNLAGGALLDLGIYPVYFSTMIFAQFPVDISSKAILGKTGIDEQSAYILKYRNGELAMLASTLKALASQSATITGTGGSIFVPEFWKARKARITIDGKKSKMVEPDFEGNGYNYEALEVMSCLKRGELESKSMSLDESLMNMQIMDSIRQQIGLVYPFEK